MIGLTLAIVQIPFWVYLIKVSLDNLKKMVVTSKAEARKAAAQKRGFYQVGYTRARCYSSLTFLVTIGVLHMNEIGKGQCRNALV